MSNDNSVPADEALEQAIRSSGDDRWSERVEAVEVLGTYLQRPEAFDRLTVMLDDSDTAVVEAAVETLAKGGGVGGMKAILKALSDADTQVGEHIRDRLVSLWLNGSPISERIREILTENLSAEVRDGAIEMIKALHLDQFDNGNSLPTLYSSLDKLAVPADRPRVSLLRPTPPQLWSGPGRRCWPGIIPLGSGRPCS
jgi:hypothetical protein